jgi:hypothetical protein
MKIAVLGWGSLIWQPRELRISLPIWKTDGPELPVEFARVSMDGRLTLVLYPNAKPVPVLWNIMATHDLDEAIENLIEREGTVRRRIGFIDLTTGESRCNVIPDLKGKIENWAEKKGFDAVIWTDLPPRFKEKTGMDFNAENVIRYLRYLEKYNDEAFKRAKEYIIKAPKQIQTEIRKVIEKTFGWEMNSL